MKSGCALRNVDPKDRDHLAMRQPEPHVCSTPPVSPRPSLPGCWGQAVWVRTMQRLLGCVAIKRMFFFLESCSFTHTEAGVSLIFVGYFFHVGLGSRQVLEPWLFFVWHTKNIWSMCVTIPITICLIWDAWSLVWVLPVLVLAEELEKSWPFCILLEKVEVRNSFWQLFMKLTGIIRKCFRNLPPNLFLPFQNKGPTDIKTLINIAAIIRELL